MLDASGVAKIGDFGTLKSIPHGAEGADGTETLRTGKPVGTRAYMAPEVVQHGEITFAGDVYSLGLVLLELLSGRKVVVNDPADLELILPQEESMEGLQGPRWMYIGGWAPQVLRGVLEDPDFVVPNGFMAPGMLDPPLPLMARAMPRTVSERSDGLEGEETGLTDGDAPKGDGSRFLVEICKLALLCIKLDRTGRPPLADVISALQKIIDAHRTWSSLSRNAAEGGQLVLARPRTRSSSSLEAPRNASPGLFASGPLAGLFTQTAVSSRSSSRERAATSQTSSSAGGGLFSQELWTSPHPMV